VAVVFTIGPDDATAIGALDESPGAVSTAPRFSGCLGTLAALMRRAAMVCASSTGPLHLAAAIGRPTLGIYAPWPTCGPGRWGPYSEHGRAIVVEAPGAEQWPRRRRRRQGVRLMGALDPETVARAVLAVSSDGVGLSARPVNSSRRGHGTRR
jgi:ADP-heptose:LPS heptosyltransferase